jgi:hypothetical protein
MTDAPEKMWVFPKKDWFNAGASTHKITVVGAKDVEYTRSDIAQDRIAKLESVLQQQIDHIYRLQNTIKSMTAHIRIDDDE